MFHGILELTAELILTLTFCSDPLNSLPSSSDLVVFETEKGVCKILSQ